MTSRLHFFSPLNEASSEDSDYSPDPYGHSLRNATPIFSRQQYASDAPETPNSHFSTPRLPGTPILSPSTPPGTPPVYNNRIPPTPTPKKPLPRSPVKRIQPVGFHSNAQNNVGSYESTRLGVERSSSFRSFQRTGEGLPLSHFLPNNSSSAPDSEMMVDSSSSGESVCALRVSSGLLRRRDSASFLKKLPTLPLPNPPLHRRPNSNDFSGMTPSVTQPPLSSTTHNTQNSNDHPSRSELVVPTPKKILTNNHNPYSPAGEAFQFKHPHVISLPDGSDVPRYLDEFSPEGVLGKGDFGTVDLVKHRFDGWSYAVKKICYRSAADRQKVQNEIYMMASLSHPNVIRYHSAWEEPKTKSMYIQMEYCYGGSLSKWWIRRLADISAEVTTACQAEVDHYNLLSENGDASMNDYDESITPTITPSSSQTSISVLRTPPAQSHHHRVPVPSFAQSNVPKSFVPPNGAGASQAFFERVESQLCQILRHTCKALRYLHEQKCVVHLDVKPDNIFVQQETTSDYSVTFKLGDFGQMGKLPEPNGSQTTPLSSPRQQYVGNSAGSYTQTSPTSRTADSNMIDGDDLDEGDGRYLAPELCLPEIDTTLLPKADIFALGCSIVELARYALGLEMLTPNSLHNALPNVFSAPFHEIVQAMVLDDPHQRPSADDLLNTFLLQSSSIGKLVDQRINYIVSMAVTEKDAQISALHEQIENLQAQIKFLENNGSMRSSEANMRRSERHFRPKVEKPVPFIMLDPNNRINVDSKS